MNNIVDLNLVLFRPKTDEEIILLRSASKIQSEFRFLNILVSSNIEQRRHISDTIEILGLSSKARIFHRFDNLGFSSGHNFLLEAGFEAGAEACLIVNPDLEIEAGSIGKLVDQSKSLDLPSLLAPTLERIGASNGREFDSCGIVWTRTGRHFDAKMGEPWEISPGTVVQVSGVTGACIFVPNRAFQKIVSSTGWFFDDLFLAYREDAELGVRASIAGVPSVIFHMEGIGHVRSVRGSARGNKIADLLGVKNRFLLLFRLGGHRPGNKILSLIRDAIVVVATALNEKSSLPGLRAAFSIRRAARYTSSVRNGRLDVL